MEIQSISATLLTCTYTLLTRADLEAEAKYLKKGGFRLEVGENQGGASTAN